jgi:iron(III) transport system ATP-binding protein
VAHLELVDLTKRYAGVASVDALSLAVEQGEFICLLGPSGCGKTTTLRMIAGFIEPDAGEIRLDGKPVSKPGMVLPPERRQMSMIFQSYAIWPHMTVAQNVSYGLRMRDVAAAECSTRVNAVLDATRLGELHARYPAELSGGQQQRVALARALAPQPEIILLDEPLSNLDANLRGDMRHEIRRLHDEFHSTSIYVTHDQVEAMTMADRIVVMNRGRIEQIGTPQEVYDRPNSRFVAKFIGGSNVLDVTHVAGSEVVLNGRTVHVGEGDFAGPGQPMSICVKTHDLEFVDEVAAGAANVIPGVVRSQAYLGSHRDYIVDVGQDLLIAAPSSTVVAPGQKVNVRLRPERCRALAR